ncbi:MAG: hypothetical protein H7Z19_00950 [Chitinophagaceae bacterium]|nr:hypothetical protein [Rubrivivax sp.]
MAVAAPLFAATVAQATDVGVSVRISQPGVYGRVDIGRFPQPQVIVAQPLFVQRARVVGPPVYMWVPPAHRARWSSYCGQYGACGAPVYFVRDSWYDQRVGPAYQARRDWRDDAKHHRADRRDDGRDDRRDWRDDRRDDRKDRGRGRGHDKDD